MVRIWVSVLHESCSTMSKLSNGSKLGHLDLSTPSYDHLNIYYSYSQFYPAVEYQILIHSNFRLTCGQFLGKVST